MDIDLSTFFRNSNEINLYVSWTAIHPRSQHQKDTIKYFEGTMREPNLT